MSPSIRMPITIASRKGISAVANDAAQERILLTSHGRVVAVVDSAERLDEDLRKIRESVRAVCEAAAESVLHRRPAHLKLNEVCAHLGIDPSEVRQRAKRLAAS